MATFKQGSTITFTIDTSLDETPIYSIIQCETTSSFNRTHNAIDVTNKCGGGHHENLGTGIKGFTIPVSGVHSDSDPGLGQIEVAMLGGHQKFQWGPIQGEIFSGIGQVTDFVINADNASAVDFTFTLEGSGAGSWGAV